MQFFHTVTLDKPLKTEKINFLAFNPWSAPGVWKDPTFFCAIIPTIIIKK